MQFSAALVAIFASVAFAADPSMPSGAADAMATGPADITDGAMPAIPSGVAECAKKCSDSKDASEAIDCLKKECADVISSLNDAATGTPGTPDGAVDAADGAADGAAAPM